MSDHPVFIIAEIGVNHNGKLDVAHKLIDEIKRAGCDAAKFQTFSAERIVTADARKAMYQKTNTGADGSQYAMLKALELSADNFYELKQHCESIGLEFMSTPFDEMSVDLLEDVGVRRYKVSSGDITNKPLLNRIGETGKPVILSTGMANFEEIGEAVRWVSSSTNPDISLLHCTSSYPTSYEDVNMRAMIALGEKFDLPIGYSDHTLGSEISIMAVSLGAKIIEKHVTLDRTMTGPDHKASLETEELAGLVAAVRHVESAFGVADKSMACCERDVALAARKSLVYAKDLPEGTMLAHSDMTVKRPGTGLPPKMLDGCVGRILNASVRVDQQVASEDFCR